MTWSPGSVRASPANPIVSIGAGQLELGLGTVVPAWYAIDKRTETCWLMLGNAAAAMDCCSLRKVAEAARILTWTSDAECSADEDATTAPPAAADSTP